MATSTMLYFIAGYTNIDALLVHAFIMLIILLSAGRPGVLVQAADPDPLQDFCVADLGSFSSVLVNGRTCKPTDTVNATDFTSQLLRTPEEFNAALGTAVKLVNVDRFPGLNTLGLTVARLDFQPSGLNTPHVHPRSSEVLYLVEGALVVAFVSAAPNYTLYQTTIHAGDLFVFPRGLVHYQMNASKEKAALAVAVLGSQNPGREDVAAVLFGSKPAIAADVLEKAFGVDGATVAKLRAGVSPTVG